MTGTILKYPGSKNKIADKIISLFPDGYKGMTYVEPFFGSGTVFFRKNPSIIETINDLNEDVYNFFLQVRDNSDELARLIEYTPWSRQEYEDAQNRTESDIENARRFLVRSWCSIGGSGFIYENGWRYNKKVNNGNFDRFIKLPELIQEVSWRLRIKKNNTVQIENCDAFILIEKYNIENALMYLDPPYVLNTRKNKKRYACEMTDDDHIRLCELVNKSQAKIILSGYANDIYNTHLEGFTETAIPAYDEHGNVRTEILWTNYKTTKDLFNQEGE